MTSIYNQRNTNKVNTKAAGDRFIPLRSHFDRSNYVLNESARSFRITQLKERYFVNLGVEMFKQRSYKEELWKKLMKQGTHKILSYFNNIPRQISNPTPGWPVFRRKSRAISAPVTILDMPGLTFNLKYHATDWSSSGCLASCHRNEVYFWHPGINFSYTHTKSDRRVKPSMKWSPNGKLIAIAVIPDGFTVLEAPDTSDKGFHKHTHCIHYPCIPTCFLWRKDNSLLVGCTSGVVYQYKESTKLSTLFWERIKFNAIFNLQFSCNERFISIQADENVCCIVETENETNASKIKGAVRVFAWHPWRESLAVVGKSDLVVELVNVSSKTVLHSSRLFSFGGNIDAVTFNPLSAELVLSIYISKFNQSMIIVMSSLNDIIDAMIWHTGKVQYLLWSPDRTQLASSGSDQSMCIWEFFGPYKDEILKRKKGGWNVSLLDLDSHSTAIR